MDASELTAEISRISVINQPDFDVEVINGSNLTMIGSGRQGAIFQVTPDTCVKVFGNEEDCAREFFALSLGQSSGLFPRVYEKGSNYILMEYIGGVDLREYLQSQPLTPALSMKLIDMLITFKQIGLERIDHHKRQIYVQPNGSLKVIDVGRTVWRNRVYPYPRKLLNSLGSEHRAAFLEHVKLLSPELFQEWQEYMQLEELAREAYQNLSVAPLEAQFETIQNLCSTLSSQSGSTLVQQIEGLLYKVFKEEQWKRAYDQALLAGAMSAQPSEQQKQQVRAETLQELKEQILNREDELWRTQKSLEEAAQRYTRRFRREQARQKAAEVRDERFAIRRIRRDLFV